uniref:Golgi apparatus membrane protein TVP23 homolog n=1 Tax=Gasterosteus aculeatus aculeatus TaxID=481459 RepID=A0AAQ4PMT1_GASAC
MLQADSLRLCFVVAPQTMADDTEDVQLDFAADEQESARRSAVIRHPLVSFFHLFFRVVTIVVYLLCDWISESFSSCFVLILTLLSFDFWSVKVRCHPSQQLIQLCLSCLSRLLMNFRGGEAEARIFWLGLIICPLIWTLFFFISLFSLKIKWLVRHMLISLQVANLYDIRSFSGQHLLQRVSD